MSTFKHLAMIELILAPVLWIAALWGAATGRQAIRQYLYFFAWYPYLLFLDAVLWRLRGQSRLLARPRETGMMCFWSVTVWLIFEALNLVLKNWAYVGVTASRGLRWPGYALAFATVLPGVLLTGEVLAAWGLWRGLKGRPLKVDKWQPLSLMLGAAFLALPLAFPRYAFPLVWGAFFFLLDPFCDLLGGKSLIGRFLAGERQETCCLLAAGLLCGVWWEAWNSLAIAKWVYTLPVLNFWKVFEMPLLGYLGFVPFALECAVMYNFLMILEERVLIAPGPRWYIILFQGIFWVVMFAAIDTWTVLCYQP